MNRKRQMLLTALLLAGAALHAVPAAAEDDGMIEEEYVEDADYYEEAAGDEVIFSDENNIQIEDDGTWYITDEGTSDNAADTTASYDVQWDVPDAILIDENSETEEVVVSSDGISMDDVTRADAEAQAAVDKVRPFLERALLDITSADEVSLNTYLTDLEQFVSPTGSDGELLASRYIRTAMEELGYTVSEQSFHEGVLNEDYVDLPGVNLIAERGANSEFRTDDIILLCAHYDSKTNPDENDPLANDKTGAAVLLEVARILQDVSSDADICFLFFSGEEDGNYGSARFVEKVRDDLKDRIRAVITVGPVGYCYLAAYGPGVDPERVSYLLGANPVDEAFETETEEEAAPQESGTDDGMIEDDGAAAVDPQTIPMDAMQIITPEEGLLENEPGNLYRATVLLDRADKVSEGAALPEDTLGLTPRHEIALATPNLPSQLAADWMFVPDYESCRANFGKAGMLAVSLFQNIDGEYRLNENGEPVWLPGRENAADTPEPSSEEAENTESAGSETTADLVVNLADLAKIADLTARVTSYYMRAL